MLMQENEEQVSDFTNWTHSSQLITKAVSWEPDKTFAIMALSFLSQFELAITSYFPLSLKIK